MAEIQFNVDQALAKLGDLVAKHGPDAVNAAAEVQQINGINTLVGGLGYAAFGGVAILLAKYCLRRLSGVEDPYDTGSVGWGAGTAATSALALIMAYATLAALLDVWAWVALFNPKLALAHAILAKVAGL